MGAIDYVATASPDFVKRHFPGGVTAESLERAPMLRFDRRDGLQARWTEAVLGVHPSPPVHWTPST